MVGMLSSSRVDKGVIRFEVLDSCHIAYKAVLALGHAGLRRILLGTMWPVFGSVVEISGYGMSSWAEVVGVVVRGPVGGWRISVTYGARRTRATPGSVPAWNRLVLASVIATIVLQSTAILPTVALDSDLVAVIADKMSYLSAVVADTDK